MMRIHRSSPGTPLKKRRYFPEPTLHQLPGTGITDHLEKGRILELEPTSSPPDKPGEALTNSRTVFLL
jgi:hypothetical protein